MAVERAIARKRLDELFERFERLGGARTVTPPHRGWIRAIRDALGMSSPELAVRLGVSAQSVLGLERSEERETIQLASLRKAADALDCDLVYYLHPREGLEASVRRQAMRRAEDLLGPVEHHGRLEAQGVEGSDRDAQLEDLADDLVDRRGLWSIRRQQS